MASSSNAEIDRRISELRREILFHQPSVKVSRFGQRFGDDQAGLTLGLVDLGECGSSVVSAMRRALRGAVGEPFVHIADHQQVSQEDRMEYLSNSLSVMCRNISCRSMLTFFSIASLVPYFTNDVIKLTKHITGRFPIAIIICDARRNDAVKLIEYLEKSHITDIYQLPEGIDSHRTMISNEEQLDLLNIIHRCLVNSEKITHGIQRFPMNRNDTAHAFQQYSANGDKIVQAFNQYPNTCMGVLPMENNTRSTPKENLGGSPAPPLPRTMDLHASFPYSLAPDVASWTLATADFFCEL
ncbi:uncharacterized protein LOC121419706 [Lytechinus variegatus]|uniref:uncharacterized protein LOC121419706 n=1 Tax=Lytechinus variegatus TaxID=7654 RepID=UPI001BB27D6A|nr:uncharacterized protein LOC121419706 [Lytechinus variegatus]